MFQFPASTPDKSGDWPSTSRVPPFGHRRINSCLQIPGAYRSLPRPSSSPEAKASSVRSSSLSLLVNHVRLESLTFFTRCLEIVVPKNEKIHFLRLINFLLLLPRYLSQYFQRSVVRHGAQFRITKD